MLSSIFCELKTHTQEKKSRPFGFCAMIQHRLAQMIISTSRAQDNTSGDVICPGT